MRWRCTCGVSERPGTNGRTLERLQPCVDATAGLHFLTDLYRRALPGNARAMRFLEGEELADPLLIDHFRLGFADRTLGRVLRDDGRDAARAARTALTRIGAFGVSGHELLRGCLVVPVLDVGGIVRQCVGYRIAPPRGSPPLQRWLQMDGPRLWNLPALDETGEVVVCDEILCALLIWRAGHRRVIACPRVATDGELAELVARIVACGPVATQLAFAADETGHRAAQAVRTALEQAGIATRRVPLPRGYDLCTFVRMHRPAAACIAALLRGAMPLARAAPRPTPRSLPRERVGAEGRAEAGPRTLRGEIAAHLEALRGAGFAPSTIAARRLHLRRFASSVMRFGVRQLDGLSASVLERFRLELAGPDAARARGPGTQANSITAIRMFCAWAVRTERMATDPARQLERPRMPRRLPSAVLSISEVERIVACPDLTTRSGIRDRAILEVLYSTGIRRMELVGLLLRDLDAGVEMR